MNNNSDHTKQSISNCLKINILTQLFNIRCSLEHIFKDIDDNKDMFLKNIENLGHLYKYIKHIYSDNFDNKTPAYKNIIQNTTTPPITINKNKHNSIVHTHRIKNISKEMDSIFMEFIDAKIVIAPKNFSKNSQIYDMLYIYTVDFSNALNAYCTDMGYDISFSLVSIVELVLKLNEINTNGDKYEEIKRVKMRGGKMYYSSIQFRENLDDVTINTLFNAFIDQHTPDICDKYQEILPLSSSQDVLQQITHQPPSYIIPDASKINSIDNTTYAFLTKNIMKKKIAIYDINAVDKYTNNYLILSNFIIVQCAIDHQSSIPISTFWIQYNVYYEQHNSLISNVSLFALNTMLKQLFANNNIISISNGCVNGIRFKNKHLSCGSVDVLANVITGPIYNWYQGVPSLPIAFDSTQLDHGMCINIHYNIPNDLDIAPVQTRPLSFESFINSYQAATSSISPKNIKNNIKIFVSSSFTSIPRIGIYNIEDLDIGKYQPPTEQELLERRPHEPFVKPPKQHYAIPITCIVPKNVNTPITTPHKMKVSSIHPMDNTFVKLVTHNIGDYLGSYTLDVIFDVFTIDDVPYYRIRVDKEKIYVCQLDKYENDNPLLIEILKLECKIARKRMYYIDINGQLFIITILHRNQKTHDIYYNNSYEYFKMNISMLNSIRMLSVFNDIFLIKNDIRIMVDDTNKSSVYGYQCTFDGTSPNNNRSKWFDDCTDTYHDIAMHIIENFCKYDLNDNPETIAKKFIEKLGDVIGDPTKLICHINSIYSNLIDILNNQK